MHAGLWRPSTLLHYSAASHMWPMLRVRLTAYVRLRARRAWHASTSGSRPSAVCYQHTCATACMLNYIMHSWMMHVYPTTCCAHTHACRHERERTQDMRQAVQDVTAMLEQLHSPTARQHQQPQPDAQPWHKRQPKQQQQQQPQRHTVNVPVTISLTDRDGARQDQAQVLQGAVESPRADSPSGETGCIMHESFMQHGGCDSYVSGHLTCYSAKPTHNRIAPLTPLIQPCIYTQCIVYRATFASSGDRLDWPEHKTCRCGVALPVCV